MTSSPTGNYRDGDIVQCQRCAKNIRVKYFDSESVVIVSTQEQQALALRCQYCGYVLCDSCAHPAESLFPVCPSCQREWGPYYFTHEAKAPSAISATAPVEIPKEIGKPIPPFEPQPKEVEEAPAATVETLAAGEVDLLRDELDRKRRNRIRNIILLFVLIFIAGVLAIGAFGPGKPIFKKALGLLNARPTRTPAVIRTQNTLVVGAIAKPTLTNTIAAAILQKPSPSIIITTATIPTSKKPVIPSPTQSVLVSTNTSIPIDKNTPVPTLTPNMTITSGNIGDCIQALSVTMNDVGKKLCVTGTVVYTTQVDNAFSIYFSEETGFLRIVVYDHVPKGVAKGVCIKLTGEIKVLLNSPVIAPGYLDVIDICSP